MEWLHPIKIFFNPSKEHFVGLGYLQIMGRPENTFNFKEKSIYYSDFWYEVKIIPENDCAVRATIKSLNRGNHGFVLEHSAATW